MFRAPALILLVTALAGASSAATAGGAPSTPYPSLGFGRVAEPSAPPALNAGWSRQATAEDEAAQAEHLPDSFFAGSGGVGPVDAGAEVGAVYVRGFALSDAGAFGAARSTARVHVGIHTLNRGCRCGR